MKGEFVFQKGIAKTIVFPLVLPNSVEYYTGLVGSGVVDAYKYGQSNAPVSVSITSSITQLGSTGLYTVTLSASETNIGDDYEYLVLKIADNEVEGPFWQPQTIILSSAVRMNHLTIKHDDHTEPSVIISGANNSSGNGGRGLEITGGETSSNGSVAGEAIRVYGGNAVTGNGEGGDAINVRGGNGIGAGPSGKAVSIAGGFGGSGGGIAMTITSTQDGADAIDIIGETKGIDIAAGTEGLRISSVGNGIQINSGDIGVYVLGDDRALRLIGVGRQGILVEGGGAGVPAVEIIGGETFASVDAAPGVLITGGVATGTGVSGSGVKIVGGDGGAANTPGHGIEVVGGASDDAGTNAGHGILSTGGVAVTAGGAGIKAVATGNGVDLDADNLNSLSTDLTTIEGKIDTVDTIVDGIATEVAVILPELTTIEGKIDTVDGIVDSILVDTGTTIPASLTTIEGKIDTVDTVVDGISTNVDTIVAKLPAGTISDLALSATIDGTTIQTIFESILAMVNGKYDIDTPSSGDITFYKRDNLTPLFVVNRTTAGRTRV